MMPDQTSRKLSRNYKRTWDIARTLGKVFFKNIEQKFGSEPDHQDFARYLTEQLGGLKGPMMKIGQILATVPGILPQAYEEIFLTLGNQAPPMGPLFVKRRMLKELGPGWAQSFKTFHMSPSCAASLGQIHRAQTHNGEVVAVKLQYPHMEDVIETDLKNLRFLCKVYERYGQAIRTDNFQAEIKDRLFEELDYELEAKHIDWFKTILKDEQGIHVPHVYPKLSSKKLLTMSWCYGEPLLHFKDASVEVREKLAVRLFRAWWKPFYTAGLLHGDPHLGNYTVNLTNHTLNLLDFGCVRVFPARVVEGMVLLFKGLLHQDQPLMREAYLKIGFKRLSTTVMKALNLWAQFLYDPLLKDEKRSITQDLTGLEGRKTAERVHALLREKGGVMPPREFVLLDRAAVGIGAALMRLDVKLNWHQLFLELIKDFDRKQVLTYQKQVMKRKTFLVNQRVQKKTPERFDLITRTSHA